MANQDDPPYLRRRHGEPVDDSSFLTRLEIYRIIDDYMDTHDRKFIEEIKRLVRDSVADFKKVEDIERIIDSRTGRRLNNLGLRVSSELDRPNDLEEKFRNVVNFLLSDEFAGKEGLLWFMRDLYTKRAERKDKEARNIARAIAIGTCISAIVVIGVVIQIIQFFHGH